MIEQCKMLASLWNAALQQREDQWRQETQAKGKTVTRARKKIVEWKEPRKGLGRFDQAREIKFIRKELPEYSAMSSASLELTIKALDLAFQAFYRRLSEGCHFSEAGYPKYKSVYHAGRKSGTIWHRDGAGWKLKPNGNNFQIYSKGISGTLTARGKLPCKVEQVRTMEIIKRAGQWYGSIVFYVPKRREAGGLDLTIDLDLLDCFASVYSTDGKTLPSMDFYKLRRNNSRGLDFIKPKTQKEIILHLEAYDAEAKTSMAQESAKIDQMKSERDKRHKKFSSRWREKTRIIAKRQSKLSKRRHDYLHRLSTNIVDQSSALTIISPKIKEVTKSAKGNEKEHGAAVADVAALNRNTLQQAPAMFVAMLEYKAKEAGIDVLVIDKKDSKLEVGKALPAAVKATRKTRKKLQEIAA